MNKCIKVDTYRLAALILECQQNQIRQQLIDVGYSEAAAELL